MPAPPVKAAQEMPETGTHTPAPEMTAAAPGTTEATTEAAEAYDDAMLDLIALEMAAPDPTEVDDGYTEADEIPAAKAPPAEPVGALSKPEPSASPPPAAIPPSQQGSHEPSLGASLIANGIVRRPDAPGSDPLAPIRRMSQAEKIAFFS